MNPGLFVALHLVLAAPPGEQAPLARTPADQTAPHIEHQPVEWVYAQQPLRIRAVISDESEIYLPSVFVRTAPKAEFERWPMAAVVSTDAPATNEGGRAITFEAIIAAERLTGERLEYFIEAFDVVGNGPARFGAPEKTLHVELRVFARAGVSPTSSASAATKVWPPHHPDRRQPENKSVFATWWFWTGAAALVAGGVVTTVILLNQDDAPPTARLRVLGPDPAGQR